MKTLAAVVVGSLVQGAPVWAQVTERASVAAGGSEAIVGADLTGSDRLVSADGRYVIFRSWSWNLVSGDTNISPDVFLRDRLLGTTERISVDSSGLQGNAGSGLFGYAMSPDGRFVVFYSEASNLVSGDVNSVADVFVRDRLSGTTALVSLDSGGVQGNAKSEYPCISADGRFVAFDSLATNLVSGDTNGKCDVFVRDLQLGTTQRLSVSTTGTESNGDSLAASISADGRFVAFYSNGSNLVAGDTNGTWDVFVYDRLNGSIELVSQPTGGGSGNGESYAPNISNDGRFVTFTSRASNLVSGDTNGAYDIFVRDRSLAVTELVSVSLTGGAGDSDSLGSGISADGRYVAFESSASNLVSGGPNFGAAYVRDRRTGTTECVSYSTAGLPANDNSATHSISGGGRYVILASTASNLVVGDSNNAMDVFVHDRLACELTSVCDPGVNNVIACPCGNQPSGSGRGCDNSSSTGGAFLSASGIAYLSMDGLVFTTGDEKPTATSILLQGTATVPNGLVFGQGVRCAGGTLKRIYVKVAVNGSIIAPDLGAGDPTVSARSAQLGVAIQPGQPYYYLVYYRDSIVLGGCSAASTFNATQTGSVTYWP
jgi:Tol biopolymer transport system component